MANPANELSANRWLRGAKLAVGFSIATISLAVVLYGYGVAVYFSNFNFGSGGDERGASLFIAGVRIGVISFLGDVAGIICGYVVRAKTGKSLWLAVSVGLCALKCIAIILLIALK